jgi:hypothetical protein
VLDDFITLSSVLIGERNPDRDLAQKYLDRLLAAPVGGTPMRERMEALLNTFREIRAGGGDLEEGVRQRIVNDDALSPVARQIIYLWYTSAFLVRVVTPPAAVNLETGRPDTNTTLQFGSPEQYFRGLMWSVIRAHPPALSGGYFGYWRYPPEN